MSLCLQVQQLTLKAPRKILEQMTVYFCFLFFRENNAWHYMWIVCLADHSHVMSSIISSENYKKHALKMSSVSLDRPFKGWLKGSNNSQVKSILVYLSTPSIICAWFLYRIAFDTDHWNPCHSYLLVSNFCVGKTACNVSKWLQVIWFPCLSHCRSNPSRDHSLIVPNVFYLKNTGSRKWRKKWFRPSK